MCVIATLMVLPFAIGAAVHLIDPLPPRAFWIERGWQIVTDLQVLVPAIYILWRTREGMEAFGLPRVHPIGDPVGGVLFAVVAIPFSAWSWSLIGPFGAPELATSSREHYERLFGPLPVDPVQWAVFAIVLLLGAAVEEVVMRGYFVTRLRQLFGSSTAAVILSAFLCATYHLYQGPADAADQMLFAILFGAVFVWVGRVWPLILAHCLVNLWSFSAAAVRYGAQ